MPQVSSLNLSQILKYSLTTLLLTLGLFFPVLILLVLAGVIGLNLMFAFKLWSRPIRITILTIYLIMYIGFFGFLFWAMPNPSLKIDPFVQAQQESAPVTKQN